MQSFAKWLETLVDSYSQQAHFAEHMHLSIKIFLQQIFSRFQCWNIQLLYDSAVISAMKLFKLFKNIYFTLPYMYLSTTFFFHSAHLSIPLVD
jgi:hypothetical protein